MVRDITNGVVKETAAPKPQELKSVYEKIQNVIKEAKDSGVDAKDIRSVFEDVVSEFNTEHPVIQKASEALIESILTEKDDKKKKDDEWSDDRSHEEAVRQIVRDAWKEIYADNKFKGEGEPTRDDVMSEVEFQSKHGLEHRPDASAIRYDAFKKVMKKVKNIVKKLDAESNETPEEEDETAKAGFEKPSEQPVQ
jgi:uncharacterized protein (UPF0335 family)